MSHSTKQGSTWSMPAMSLKVVRVFPRPSSSRCAPPKILQSRAGSCIQKKAGCAASHVAASGAHLRVVHTGVANKRLASDVCRHMAPLRFPLRTCSLSCTFELSATAQQPCGGQRLMYAQRVSTTMQREGAHLSRLLTPMRNATWMSRYENQIGKKSRIMFATMMEYLFCGVSCMTAHSLFISANHTAVCGGSAFVEHVGHPHACRAQEPACGSMQGL